MSIFVVRHAKAGSRHDWDGDDTERPLTKAGRRQSEELARHFADEAISGRVVEPGHTLRADGRAARLGPTGSTSSASLRLAEGAALDEVLGLLTEVPDGAVLCSHGDVIPELLDGLVRRGTHVVGTPEWRKASIWTLDPPGVDGAVATARAEPPPAG